MVIAGKPAGLLAARLEPHQVRRIQPQRRRVFKIESDAEDSSMKAFASMLFAALALALELPSSAVDTSLLDVIRRGDAAAVQALLKAGADPNVREETDATALMYAAIYSSPTTMRLLLDRGADVNAANSNGSTALMWATGETPKVRLLARPSTPRQRMEQRRS